VRDAEVDKWGYTVINDDEERWLAVKDGEDNKRWW
jgi:hypothetical protein